MSQNILEILGNSFKDTKNDGVSFTPTKKGFELHFFALKGKNKYELYDLGNMYHIVLYKQKGSKIFDVDRFESILTSPQHYVENIIKLGYFGVVLKKTKKSSSKKFIDAIHKNLLNDN